jgi:hypothetical protein
MIQIYGIPTVAKENAKIHKSPDYYHSSAVFLSGQRDILIALTTDMEDNQLSV